MKEKMISEERLRPEQEMKPDEHPWDDNLPKNKEYIKKFYKKTEKEIKKQEGEGKINDYR